MVIHQNEQSFFHSVKNINHYLLMFYVFCYICSLTINYLFMSENVNTPKASNGMATASLVLGIVSIVLCFFWVVGVISGILAIVLALVAKSKIKADSNLGGSGAATGGLITGIIGVILSVIIVVVAIMFVGAVMDAGAQGFEEAFKELDKYKVD